MFNYFYELNNILQTPITAIFKNSYNNKNMCQHCLLLEGEITKNIP